MPRISSYTLVGTPLDGDEWVPIVDDPSTTPVTKRVTVANLWNQSGYYARLVKGADTSRASNATLTADPDLVLAVLANTKYIFKFGLYVVTGTTPDWKHQLTGPAGATFMDYVSLDANTVVRDESTVYTNTGMAVAQFFTIEGSIIVAGTAGNLGINWAQNTSNGTATVVKAGSFLELKRATA